MKQLRRNQIKKPTNEALLLKKIRQDRGISIRKAAKLMGKSDSWLAHFETGRFDPKPHDYERVASFFNLTLRQLESKTSAVNPDELVNTREECHLIINRLPQDKLQAVYQILKVF